MSVTRRSYRPRADFGRVRDFLVSTHSLFDPPLNWRLERWNYARYFVTPLLATEGLGEPDLEAYLEAIRLWDESTGLWQDASGEIVGVVNIEHADRKHRDWGEAFFQRHPEHEDLLPGMLDFAEARLRNRQTHQLFFWVNEEDEALQAVARERGYEQDAERIGYESVLIVSSADLEPVPLPPGYRLQSMADHNDPDGWRTCGGRAFNHPDPNDWPSLLACQELQRAPDYRLDLDIHVRAPGGEMASFCLAWWDEHNRIGSLEPVGTVPEHRRLGLARATVLEAIRRLADLGAEQVYVGSGQEFYKSLGFEARFTRRLWSKGFARDGDQDS